jgi:hypothetical protein
LKTFGTLIQDIVLLLLVGVSVPIAILVAGTPVVLLLRLLVELFKLLGRAL